MGEFIVQEQEIPRAPAKMVAHQVMDANPAQLLQLAMQQGAGLDTLERFMMLKKEWEADEARKAFVAGLSAFKADPPDISKNKHVKIKHRDGNGFTEYDHATLDHVSAEIGKALAKQGMSHRWDVEQMEGGVIKVTCVLQHVLGHSERVTLQSLADTSGSKNSIQAIGSTISYLQRYTLMAATGVAAKDVDDDGAASEEPKQDSNLITAEQAGQLRKAATVAGKDDAYVCQKARVTRLEDIQAARFDAAMNHLKKLAMGDQ